MKSPHWILFSMLLACAGLTQPVRAAKVRTQGGKQLHQYKSYQWFPPRVLTKLGLEENHVANPVLKEIVGRQLTERGMTEVAEGADLQIQVWVFTESVPQVEALIYTIDPNMLYGAPITMIGRYNRQGTLFLNLIDRRTNKSAWIGMVTDSLPTGTLEPEQIRAQLDKAANNIFKKYPVKKK
jgi:uncharacterized protein DUF4136